MNCGNCGQPIESDAAFCGNCGAPIAHTASNAPAKPATTDTEATVTPAVTPKPETPTPLSSETLVTPTSVSASTPTPAPESEHESESGPKPEPKPEPEQAPFGPPTSPKPVDSPISQNVSNTPAEHVSPIGSPAPAAAGSIPGYAIANPNQQNTDIRSTVGLVLASIAILAGAFYWLAGVVLATAGLIIAATAPATVKGFTKKLTIGLSIVALLVSIASLVYVFNHQKKTGVGNTSVGAGQTLEEARGVETPCYKAKIPTLKSYENTSGTCNLRTYDSDSLATTTRFYTVDTASQDMTESEFATTAKDVVSSTFKSTMPNAVVSAEKTTMFAGSPAYVAEATDSKDGTTLSVALVLHKSGHGENLFVLVNGTSDDSANVMEMANAWEWK